MATSPIAQVHSSSAVCPMKWYQTGARYLLGLIFLFGAIDGALFLFFGIYMHGKPREAFLAALQGATYFWAFMKLIQFIGAASLLLNYKPALGVALLVPIASVMFLFYLFELPSFLPLGLVIIILMLTLCRAYSKSYVRLCDDYS